MSYIKTVVFFTILSFMIFPTSAQGQTSDIGLNNFFYEVDIDINQVNEPVQTNAGRQELGFYSYYAVLNSDRVNSRAFRDLTGLYSRKSLYENLIDELAAQAELSPFYVLKNNFISTFSSITERKEALLFTIPILGVTDELYPIIEPMLNTGLDEPVGKGLDIAGQVLQGMDQLSDLSYVNDALDVLDGAGLTLSGYRLLEDTRQMAISFTVFMALDLEMYRIRLEKIKQLANIEDPAFWYAIDKVERRLEFIDRSYWLRTYQFAIDNMEELMSLRNKAGMLTLNAVKAKLGASMAKFVPWIGASAFAHGQLKMAEQHRRSLAYGTLAGTLYKDLEGKDSGLQSYLGYIYLRERNMAFRNWTTTVFSFLNFNSWSEMLDEYQRGYDEYRNMWLKSFLDQFLTGGHQIVEREKELSICDVWSVANSGGVEGTIDRWDISELPEGVMLDIRYDMKRIPDRLTLKYPDDAVQLETGWRGSSSYEGSNYPGGIKGPGTGTELDVFRKDADNHFIVEVYGVDEGTYWEYQVRCREENRSGQTHTLDMRLDQIDEPDVDISEPAAAERRGERGITIGSARINSEPRDTYSEDTEKQEEAEADVIWITENKEDEEVVENIRSRPAERTRQKDYRTKQLLSFDYSNIVSTNSSLFRNENLLSASSGTSFSVTGYYLDGFRSGRAGIMYVSSSGTISALTNSGFTEETFDYSHISLYASYSPSFEIYDSRTTYLAGYFDVGASAILASLTYNDYEEIFDGNFIDIYETEISIEDEWFPGINFGAGVLYNYKYLGFHLGYMAEFTIIEELGTSFINFFPQLGVSIRRG